MTTKAERLHLDRVAQLGCVVCRNMGIDPGETGIHHIRTGQGHKRATHFEVLPLCPPHHQTGGYGIAFHAGPEEWEKRYGSELELLEQVRRELGIG